MMKHLSLLVTLAVFVGTTQAVIDLPAIRPGCPPPNCSKNRDLLFPHADQTLFYQCAPAGQDEFAAVELACPESLWFSYEDQTCVFPVNWRGVCGEYWTTTVAPELCGEPRCETDEQILTLHPAADPAFFWQCTYRFGDVYEPKKMPCAPGTLFSFEQQTCVLPHDWSDVCDESLITSPVTPPTRPPPIDVCPAPSCTDEADFNVLHPAENPKNYFKCVGDAEAIMRSCPSGLFFGFQQQECVMPCLWEDGCSGSATTSPVTTASPTVSTTIGTPPPTTIPSTTTASPEDKCSVPLCKLQAEINVKHPSVNPHQYYVCLFDTDLDDFVSVLHFCPTGLFFNNARQECVAPCYWEDACSEEPTGTTANTTPSSTTRPTTSSPSTSTAATTAISPNTTSSGTTSTPNTSTGTTRTTSPVTTTTPLGSCSEPACLSSEDIARLHPSRNPQDYYECVSLENGWHVAVLRICEAGQLFGFREQKCVDACDWEDVCSGEPTGTTHGTSPVTPEETTSSAPTVTPPSGGACDIPACVSQWELETLHPARESQHFYQCARNNEGGHYPVLLTCPSGLWFSNNQQVCVWPRDWVDACGDHNGTSPVTPEETTTVWTDTTSITSAPSVTPPYGGACEVPACVSQWELVTLHPAREPQHFYQCAPNGDGGHDAILMTCPPGLWFGYSQQVCVWPSDWVVVCQESNGTTPVTPEGTTTNPTQPPAGSCLEPVCKNILDLLKLFPSNNPTNYYQCTITIDGYQVVTRKCAFGLLFSDSLQTCVLPVLWTDVCTNNTGTTTEMPSTTTEQVTITDTPELPSPSCGEAPDCDQPALRVLHPASVSVSMFYRCEPVPNGFEAVLRVCTEGTWFSFWAQGCVWPADWEGACGEEVSTTTEAPETTTTSFEVTTTTVAPVTLPTPSCVEAPDCDQPALRVLHPTSISVSMFYRCEPVLHRFVAVLRECNTGAWFSYSRQECVWPADWEGACGEEISTTTESLTSQPPPAELCGVPSCDHGVDRLYPHENPKRFYRCTLSDESTSVYELYEAVVEVCPNSMFFGVQQQECVPTCDWVDHCDSWNPWSAEIM